MSFKAKFYSVRKFIVGILILSAVFTGGYYLGVSGYTAKVDQALHVTINRQTPPDKNVDMSLFWQVWDTLSAKYYDKTKILPSEMVYGAIQGMVASLGDPYTMFLPPKENKVVDEDLSGSFEGVGIEIGFRGQRLAVVSPISGSPAEAAGVKAGDYIVQITDKKKNIDTDTAGITLPQAVSDIRGPSGSVVTLTVLRDGGGKPITIDITRAKLDVPSVILNYVGQNKDIADVRVTKFAAETPAEWNKTVSQILQKPDVKGIIVDLRNNPGGYLQGAVDLASDFLPTGTTVVIQDGGNSGKQEYKTQSLPKLAGYKTVILINGGSASASEIFSGALRDQKGVKLIGEKSFGKGTIQEPIEINGGSGLHVTTAKWLTPDGTWVHGVGLMPDIEVALDASAASDTQLQKAVDQF